MILGFDVGLIYCFDFRYGLGDKFDLFAFYLVWILIWLLFFDLSILIECLVLMVIGCDVACCFCLIFVLILYCFVGFYVLGLFCLRDNGLNMIGVLNVFWGWILIGVCYYSLWICFGFVYLVWLFNWFTLFKLCFYCCDVDFDFCFEGVFVFRFLFCVLDLIISFTLFLSCCYTD